MKEAIGCSLHPSSSDKTLSAIDLFPIPSKHPGPGEKKGRGLYFDRSRGP